MMIFDVALEIENADRFEHEPPYPVAWKSARSVEDNTEGAEDTLTATVWRVGEGHYVPGYVLESGGALLFSSMSEVDIDAASMTADFCTGWAIGSSTPSE